MYNVDGLKIVHSCHTLLFTLYKWHICVLLTPQISSLTLKTHSLYSLPPYFYSHYFHSE